jgi:hypothetical protein
VDFMIDRMLNIAEAGLRERRMKFLATGIVLKGLQRSLSAVLPLPQCRQAMFSSLPWQPCF